MRVIAGIARGRKLYSPKGRQVRPTADRVKKSLFDVLAQQVVGAQVLDLYAGTGSLGIEALSRGAKSALFVDELEAATEAIKKNLVITGFSDQARVFKGKVTNILRTLSLEKKQFDLIFLDPPYKIGLIIELEDIFSTLAGGNFLSHQGVVVLEHSSRKKPPSFENFLLKSTRKYGDTRLNFYLKKEAYAGSSLSGDI